MVKIHDFNRAEGKPIVNLTYANGFPPETYERALAPLFDKYHVISIQLRPLWDKPTPADQLKHWSQFSDDILAALDEITDQPIINIGHSFGGMATIYASLKCPERFSRLVLIEPTMLSPFILAMIWLVKHTQRTPRVALVEGALRRRTTWDSKQDAFAYFREKRLFKRWSEDGLRSYVESMLAPGSDGKVHLVWSPEWEAQIYRTLPLDVWTYPRRIQHPFMLIRGDLTDTFGAMSARSFRLLRLGLPTDLHVVQGAGHLVPQEKPDEVGKLIADFLL